MDKEKIAKRLDRAIEKQVPDVWNKVQTEIGRSEDTGRSKLVVMQAVRPPKRNRYKHLSIAAAACLLTLSALSITPVRAAIQEVYDKIFSSEHIDDKGLKAALTQGQGQEINQTYYDKKNDITVHFQSVLADDKETKLLFTYKSDKTDLKNYYVDIFEGASSIYLVDHSGSRTKLNNVGWGSRYYNHDENTVAEAESFAPIKQFKGQDIRLEIVNLTIYSKNGSRKIETIWPLNFKLDQSAISSRETIELNKDFSFEGQSYKIKQVEFSRMETRVVVTGTDTKLLTDETGDQYHVLNKLERQFLNARKFDKEHGFYVNEGKSGIFIKSAGERIDPIFSKNEVREADDDYIMIFAPVKDQQDAVLEIGKALKIPLSK